MKGSYHIRVENERIKYEFDIKRNITVIQGDSATGKTNLIEMIGAYYDDREKSGISIVCDRECAVLGGRDWEVLLRSMKEKIVFIDEGNPFVKTTDFGSYVGDGDNYYVVVSREGMPNLPYSVEEIYGIRQSGKYAGLKKTYNELYRIYEMGSLKNEEPINDAVIEDTNSGFEFFDNVIPEGISCVSAGGKSRIKKILKDYENEAVLVVADGAAFGSEMREISEQIRMGGKVTLFLPESFEWLILCADIIDDAEIREILIHPEDYIDSKEFVSWERFFTSLLRGKTEGTYLQYNKAKLNSVYLNEKEKKKLVEQIPEMIRKKLGL